MLILLCLLEYDGKAARPRYPCQIVLNELEPSLLGSQAEMKTGIHPDHPIDLTSLLTQSARLYFGNNWSANSVVFLLAWSNWSVLSKFILDGTPQKQKRTT
ncbi:hypothetical protein D3C73_1033730 [compost metagenome]